MNSTINKKYCELIAPLFGTFFLFEKKKLTLNKMCIYLANVRKSSRIYV